MCSLHLTCFDSLDLAINISIPEYFLKMRLQMFVDLNSFVGCTLGFNSFLPSFRGGLGPSVGKSSAGLNDGLQ